MHECDQGIVRVGTRADLLVVHDDPLPDVPMLRRWELLTLGIKDGLAYASILKLAPRVSAMMMEICYALHNFLARITSYSR